MSGPVTSPGRSGSRTEAPRRHPRGPLVAERRPAALGPGPRRDCRLRGADLQRRHPLRDLDQGLPRQARGRRGVGGGAVGRGFLPPSRYHRARFRLSPASLCRAGRQVTTRPLRPPACRAGHGRGRAPRHLRSRYRRPRSTHAVVSDSHLPGGRALGAAPAAAWAFFQLLRRSRRIRNATPSALAPLDQSLGARRSRTSHDSSPARSTISGSPVQSSASSRSAVATQKASA
jgi:hypothetical protein